MYALIPKLSLETAPPVETFPSTLNQQLSTSFRPVGHDSVLHTQQLGKQADYTE